MKHTQTQFSEPISSILLELKNYNYVPFNVNNTSAEIL